MVMLRYFVRIMAVVCFLPYGCSGPLSTKDRTIAQPPQPGGTGPLKVCTERVPDYYNAAVDSRVKAALPLAGKTEAQAEASIQAYLRQEAGGTKSGKDLQDILTHICQMANNGNWSEATTERIINRFIDRWGGGESEARKPKVEITFNGLSQKELQAKFPLPLVLEPSLTATLSFVVTNVGDGSVLNPLISVFVEPKTVSVDRTGYVHETKPNHHRYQVKGITLLPKEMSDASYEFTAEVLVPEGIDTFILLFKIVGDNLPHNDLDLNFKAIHYKRPGGS
jgi:hypothetical protein